MPVPAPRSLIEGEGAFTLGIDTRLHAGPGTDEEARLLREALSSGTGLPLEPAPTAVEAGLALAVEDRLGPEAYRLEVTPDRVRITGGDAAGVFHGTQTLRQLLPAASLRRAPTADRAWTVPAVRIEDRPAHAWRGLMLDVARRFLPVRDVLRVVDLLALHHLNRLHLHLTDDQGWRVEIARHPRLTEVGGWRTASQLGTSDRDDGRPHGGWYTRDDVREIVAYAAARHVVVVPEIEVPGHARAALAAHPELGVRGVPLDVWTRWGICEDVFNVEESTLTFLEEVFDEVLELFPGPYVGLGGDECPKRQWREDPRTQERRRELGLADEEALQAWFVGRIAGHLRERGRQALGWDEILEGGTVGTDAIVLAWRGSAGARAAVRRGHRVVACPDDRAYLDYRQSDRDDEPIPVSVVLGWREVYDFEPVPADFSAQDAALVLGGQANLWTEHIDSARRLDYQLFPRLGAIAEVLWTGPQRDIEDFERRLPAWRERLEALGVEGRPEAGPHPWQTVPGVPGRPATREERDAWLAEVTAPITR